MEINYVVVGLIILAIIVVVLMIRKNRTDEKDFEKTINQSEVEPEQHKTDEI